MIAEETLEIVSPSVELEEAYLEMLREFVEAGEGERYARLLAEAEADFAGFVTKRQAWAVGRDLPEGCVPCSEYWMVRDGRVVGWSSLRHRLTDHLLNEGGHIGYRIRPGERRKGYATQLLAHTLNRARGRFLARVLLTCDKTNVASARVIQKNGGVLEDERVAMETGTLRQRYWIDLWK